MAFSIGTVSDAAIDAAIARGGELGPSMLLAGLLVGRARYVWSEGTGAWFYLYAGTWRKDDAHRLSWLVASEYGPQFADRGATGTLTRAWAEAVLALASCDPRMATGTRP